ncbi:MAG: ATP-binding protein [Bacteroidetes bacterium]|nr:ATP-binding protein [Bacteroidota bacterium]MBL6943785.1 ATP-binding protein [Bacteroidales bacterium]
MINRIIYRVLREWKEEINRKPLLIRGARQVGKSYIVEEFGKTEFSNYITLNFERNPEYKDIFTSLNPIEIIEKISLFTGKSVVKGKTLIFLDEIQECAQSIIALRYFYEEMPEQHIIGAGSLLEFALKTKGFKMPVGRIQYLYMHPLSFSEFIVAFGEKALNEYISKFENLSKIPESLHIKLIELVRKYFVIGGMPAVVNEYIGSRNIIKCQKIQRSIIDTYTDDFGKYSSKSKFQYLQNVFYASASMIGQKFVYSKVDKHLKSRELKEALELLETAGIITRIKRSNGAGIPMEANVKSNYFKILFLDVGLLHNISGIQGESLIRADLASIFKGAIAEQFTGQELLVSQDFYKKPVLYYWTREAKNSNAEIDYLMEYSGEIIPIEVKSGNAGRMKSMIMFMDQFDSRMGLKISQSGLSETKNITSVPFYGVNAFFNK